MLIYISIDIYLSVSISISIYLLLALLTPTQAGAREAAICDYAAAVLDALAWRWGPSHLELRYGARGPVLVEANVGRFNGVDFAPLTTECIGYGFYEAALGAFCDRAAWDALPPRFGLYKILYRFKALLWESIMLLFPPPTCKAYPIAILLHAHCAIYALPPTPLLYAIHHTILVMAISCKGQAQVRLCQTIEFDSTPAQVCIEYGRLLI